MTAHDTRPGIAPVRPARPANPPSAVDPDPRRWRALPVLLAGTFLVVLDFFVVNVALPAIQTGLHTGASTLEWVVAGYGLTFAVFLITAGRLADHFGRRRVFALGLAAFVLASAACGLAPDPLVLIIARLVQGGAAAAVSATVLAIIGVTYTGSDRARAISAYGMAMGLAAVGGQLIGGALISADVAGLGWRAIFLVNVPIGLGALAATRLVPESRVAGARSLDVVGMLLSALVLTAVTLPLIEGRQDGWPVWTWISFGCAPILAAALTVQQRRRTAQAQAPLFAPELLRVPAFRAGLLVQLVYWCSQAPLYLVLALYLQEGRGLSALRSGLVFLALAVGYLATSMRAPALLVRFGPKVLIAGATTLTVGLAGACGTVAAIGVDGSSWLLVPALTAVGAGLGLCITPLTMTVLSHATPQQAGIVSGALSTAQQVGNTIGVAVTGLIFFRLAPSGYAGAFGWSLAELALLTAAVVVLARVLLIGRRRTDQPEGQRAGVK
jgi:EmrB/QacA subfamily drug resistance transporter